MKYYTPTKLSENIKETPEGFLVCLGVAIARTGWQLYGRGETPLEVGSDGKVNIYRSADEVFHPNTIASYEGKAVTLGHPAEFVSPQNWSVLAKGFLQNVRRSSTKDENGEESLIADVLITDSFAIQLVKAGLREVSCGYECIYDQTGEGKGIQKNIIGNHLALVEEGRAGPTYAINDHKIRERLIRMSKFSEKVKLLFSKALDEAAAGEDPDKNKPAKDGETPSSAGEPATMDAIMKMMKDMSDAMTAFMKPKDAAPAAPEEKKPEEKPADNPAKDADVNPDLEARLKRIEDALAKLMGAESAEAGDDDADGDGEGEDSYEAGDTASRAEILAPGLAVTKDVKVIALKKAYETKLGKAVIDSLTGGKTPTFDSKETVSNLFIAASEILKSSRGVGLDGTKSVKAGTMDKEGATPNAPVSPEKLNEINQAYWATRN